MTKKELIDALKDLPDDYKILMWDSKDLEWKNIAIITYPENAEITIIPSIVNFA